MVDVSSKEVSERTAVAAARVHMQPRTLELLLEAGLRKGDALAVAQVAGIMGAKRTPELIPMCHPLSLTAVDVDFEVDRERSVVTVKVTAKTLDRTGVEMEALVGAAAAALTLYDMCKAVDRSMTVTDLRLLAKEGGRSGAYHREED
jgi:cyclic pyranopterin phosphate synthase